MSSIRPGRARPRPGRLRAAVSAGLTAVLAATLVAVPVGTVAPAVAAEPSLTFVGHGWGHGRGMGQYGAYGYAVDHGWGYQQILDHYYGGTRLANDAGNPSVQVAISRLDGADLIVTGPGLVVEGVPVSAAAVLVRRVGDGSFAVFGAPGCAGPWSQLSTISNPHVEVWSNTDPGVQTNLLRLCEVGKTTGVRGSLAALSEGGRQTNINALDLDDYLRSVVASESIPSWGTAGGGRGMQALYAQAVAARSYVLSGRQGQRICDTTACQVYSGAFTQPDGGALRSIEHPSTDTAVRDTSGQVRRHANGTIARTEYSSSTGGWTAGGTFPAVVDLGDTRSPYHDWSVTIPQSRVASALGVGSIASIAVTARNGWGAEGGRVTQLTVRGTDGRTATFTGDQVRSRLGLRSDWFSIAGVSQEQATKLVNALYQDILGRSPDPTGLATWSSYVMATGDTGPVSQGIVTSYERVYTFVQRQYRTALGREPDPTGTATWVDHMYRGMGVPELQVQVYASQEAVNVMGKGSMHSWVDGVYRGILGRSANGVERDFWVTRARTQGTHGVVREIVLSDESALRRLEEYYQLMLGRSPDPSGIATYRPMMNGQGDFVLPIEIGRSVEYFNRAQTR